MESEIALLPDFLLKAWSRDSYGITWEMFRDKWEITIVDGCIKYDDSLSELLNHHKYLIKMWEKFRDKKTYVSLFKPRKDIPIREIWKMFRDHWELDGNGIRVFEEMSKLSEQFFSEWEMYYFDASYKEKGKSNCLLWEDFKKEWRYCFSTSGVSEDYFNACSDELSEISNLSGHLRDEWYEHRGTSRDMSVMEEHALWLGFKDAWF